MKSTANGGVCKQDGTDILFTLGDGVTKLNHELDSYDPVAGTVTAWVNLPTLSTAGASVYMYYGNTADSEPRK